MRFSKGQSILGVIIAMAIFALMASSIAKTSVGNISALNQGGEQSRAEALAIEAVESVRAIKDGAWNDLYSSTTIAFADYDWSFESSNVETIGDYTRTVEFADVCRDGSNVITTCPGTTTDLQAKKVTVTVAWEVRPGLNNSVVKEFYLTNWDSREWTQTDWSSGPGQSILSDLAAFYSADEFVDYSSTPGEIKIMELAGGEGCIAKSWDFDTAEEYTYTSSEISIASSKAYLNYTQSSNIESFGGSIIGSTDNYSNNAYYGSYYRNKLIHISGDIYAMVYNYGYYYYGGGYYGRIYVRTMEISPEGVIVRPNIRTTYIGYYYSYYGYKNLDVKYVGNNMYVVSAERFYYTQSSTRYLSLTTFTVSTDGSTITQKSYNSGVDSPSYDPYLEEISPGYFAVIYRYSTTQGRIRTFSVNSTTGAISYISLYSFDTVAGDYPYIKKTTGNQFLISYRGSGGTLQLKTINISNTGVIDTVNVQSYQLDSYVLYSKIEHVSGNIYAVVYSGPGVTGWVQTVSVDPTTGVISEPANNSLQIDATYLYNLDFAKITGTSYIVAYRGPDNDGFAKLVSINDDGSVGTVSDTYEFYTADVNFPSIVQLGNYYFGVMVNNGIGNTTYQKDLLFTFSAGYGVSYSSGISTIEPTISYTPSGFGSFVGFDEVSTKTNGGEIYYQLSDNNGSDWKYWDGSSWATTTLSTDYNTAEEVGLHISGFSTSTGPVSFKAYFDGDGTQNIELDKITLDCKEEFGYDYNDKTEYTYDKWKVDFRDGIVGVKPALTTSTAVWDFSTYSQYYYNSIYIDVSGGQARLVYLGLTDTITYDYTTSAEYLYDSEKIEFEEDMARLKHIGSPLGLISDSPIEKTILAGIPAYASDIVHVREDIYAYVYNLDNFSSGKRTVRIINKRISSDGVTISNDLGSYTLTVNSTATTEGDDRQEIGIVKLSDGYLALAYSSGSNTYVATVSVDVNGVFSYIASSVIYHYSPSDNAQNFSIAKVENATDIYVVSFDYLYQADTFYLKTIPISSTGVIGTIISSYTVATDNGPPYYSYAYRNPNIMYMSGDVYVLSYDWYSPYSWELGKTILRSFRVDATGNIYSMPSSAGIDSVSSSSLQNRNVSMVKLSDNYLALVYQDKDRNGWLKTYSVSASGGIGSIDSFEYKTNGDGAYPDIVSLGSDNYAILSNKVDDYGTIDTFNISSSGIINITPLDSYIYDSYDGDSAQITNVGTGIYAIGYQGAGGVLNLSTKNISSAGVISSSFIANDTLNGGGVKDPKIIQVRDDIYVYSYSSSNYSGYGPTTYFSSARISNNGTLLESKIDSFNLAVYSLNYISEPQYGLLKISDGVFAIIYGSGAYQSPGILATYSVDTNGIITLVDSYSLGTYKMTPNLTKVNGSSNIFALSYQSSNNVNVSTITIDDNGDIGITFIDTYSYYYNGIPTGYTSHYHEKLLYVRDNIYVLSFDRSETFYYYRYSGLNLISIEIESNGNIVNANNGANAVVSLISDYNLTNSSNYYVNHAVSIEKISGSQIAVAYTNFTGTSYLVTYTVNSNGTFSSHGGITLATDSGRNFSDIEYLAEKTFVISYTKSSQCILDSYDFSLDGVIDSNTVDTYTYDNYGSGGSNVIKISGDIYAILHETEDSAPALTTLNVSSTPLYSTDNPSIESSVTEDFSVDSWDGFTETTNKDGGEIYYQISDNGTDWYYWNNTSWVEATTSSQSNIATVVSTNISTFTTSTNGISVKALLSSDGSQKVALDNIDIPFTRTITGYASNLPTISATSSGFLYVPSVYSWRGFSHTVSTTSPGDVYYQLSNDDGVTWQYWDGSAWVEAIDADNYNTVSEVDTNIEEFDATSKKISFRAFLKSDTIQQVELDDVTVTFNIEPADEYTTNLWHFDDTGTSAFVDSIGNYHISKYSSATQDEIGKFDSAGKSVYYLSNASNLPTLPSNFTVEMWVKVGSTYSRGYNFLNGFYVSNQPANTGGYSLTSYNGSLAFTLNKNGPSVSASSVLSQNTWTHVAVTYDGSYIRLYVNGVYKAATYFVGTIYNNYGRIYIGEACSTSYPCYIDEMRISNIARWTSTSGFIVPTTAYAGEATYETSNPSVTVVSSTSYTASSLGSIVETASKDGGEIYYQLSDDAGSTWKYWNGSSWATAGSTDYNTAIDISNNLSVFSTSTGQIAIKAFLSSDGTQNVRLDDIKFLFETATGVEGGSGAGSGGGFATSTYFVSSAFDMGDNSPVQFLDWDQDLSSCNDCAIKIQSKSK